VRRSVQGTEDLVKTCVIIASGPSLTDAQCAVVHAHRENLKVIVINSSYQKAPWADVVYAGDYLWWKVHNLRVKAACPKAERWTQDHSAAERYQLHHRKGVNRPGLGLQHIHMNGNSAFQALNLAFLWGHRRILLLGFDMRHGPGGLTHWHGDHEKPLVQRILPEEWVKKSVPLAADLKQHGCEVINCTPGSALTCFTASTIEKELG
jgi:hypothetical protein